MRFNCESVPVIRRIALVLLGFFFILVLALGWERDTFIYRVATALFDNGVDIDEKIPKPKKQSFSHQVLWKGDIESADLKESSGLTVSTRNEGVLWSVNDSGAEPEVFALSINGDHLGKWRLTGTDPNDWEGMDSFKLEDKHYLLIGDTGDNFRSRKKVSFLVIEEPLLDTFQREIAVSWQTDFHFPDGPKDVEAVAVDIERKRAIFLNKRELPLRLYSVPLFPTNGKIIAEKIGELVAVPRYRSDLSGLYGRTALYLGLPTGMDLFEDKLLITTYRNAYLYNFEALEEQPEEIPLPFSGQREAITFGLQSSRNAYVSRERKNGTQVADIFEIIFNDLPDYEKRMEALSFRQ